MLSQSEKNNFKQKVFCMNNNPPKEVRGLDQGLADFSVKIKPDEATIKRHRGYAQTVRNFSFIKILRHFRKICVFDIATDRGSVENQQQL